MDVDDMGPQLAQQQPQPQQRPGRERHEEHERGHVRAAPLGARREGGGEQDTVHRHAVDALEGR